MAASSSAICADGSIPYLGEHWIEAAYTPESARTDAQQKMLALSDSLIDEMLSADVIVLGIPRHNFSVPTFEAWIDQIARAGKTFSYSDQGLRGLIPSDKKVIVILTRGGVYAGESPQATTDSQVPYLRQVLGLIGLTDATFIHAERQGMGGGQAAQLATEKALQPVASLFPPVTSETPRNAYPLLSQNEWTPPSVNEGGVGGFVANQGLVLTELKWRGKHKALRVAETLDTCDVSGLETFGAFVDFKLYGFALIQAPVS